MKRVSTPCGPASTRATMRFDAVPACGAIVEFLEATQLLATCPGSTCGHALLQRGDALAQRGGRRHSQRVASISARQKRSVSGVQYWLSARSMISMRGQFCRDAVTRL
jgi:hypothetical protein